MDRLTDRHTNIHRDTGIIPCVILRLRVRVLCKETGMSRIFTPPAFLSIFLLCGCVFGRMCVSEVQVKNSSLDWYFPPIPSSNSESMVVNMFKCVEMHLFLFVLFFFFVPLRDRWRDHTREQHRLGFCAVFVCAYFKTVPVQLSTAGP